MATRKLQLLSQISLLPPATPLTLGCVIPGNGLLIDSKGTVSLDLYYIKQNLEIDTSGLMGKDLSLLDSADLTKKESRLYIDEDGEPKATTIGDFTKEIIHTEHTSGDTDAGNYIFREI